MVEKKYIDIEAAKNALCRYCHDISNWRMCGHRDECTYLCRLDGVPAADVREMRRGRKEKAQQQPYFRGHFPTFVCSECHREVNKRWNYCPNCGADMRGKLD